MKNFSSPIEVVSPPEMSQARQRLSVASNAASGSAAASSANSSSNISNVSRGATALSFLSNG
jgi:hypothetical protein